MLLLFKDVNNPVTAREMKSFFNSLPEEVMEHHVNVQFIDHKRQIRTLNVHNMCLIQKFLNKDPHDYEIEISIGAILAHGKEKFIRMRKQEYDEY